MKPFVQSDDAFNIMTEITENQSISQRELSQKLGISLGAVNALLNKMMKDGLVKIEKIPPKRVLYMLTPVGMMEKAKKTIQYVKVHYDAIHSFLSQLESIVKSYKEKYDVVYVLKTGSSYDEVLINAMTQIGIGSEILVIENVCGLKMGKESVAMFYISEEDLEMPAPDIEGVNLLGFF